MTEPLYDPEAIPVTDLTKGDPRRDTNSPQYDANFARLRGDPPKEETDSSTK